jgi:hypothetical protein
VPPGDEVINLSLKYKCFLHENYIALRVNVVLFSKAEVNIKLFLCQNNMLSTCINAVAFRQWIVEIKTHRFLTSTFGTGYSPGSRSCHLTAKE